MIRSTTVTLKFANQNKQDIVNTILDEYKVVTQFFVDCLWEHYPIGTKIPTFIPKPITDKVTTWLSTRINQCAAKQASSIVRGCRTKFERRTFIYEKLKKEGNHKQARKLAKKIAKNPISKPELKTIEAELNSNLFKIDWNNNTNFDGWIIITCIGNKIKLILPFKSHKKLNQLKEIGTQTGTIKLAKNKITFSFEIPEKVKATGLTVGVDIGMNTPFACSNNIYNEEKCNGHTIQTVCERLKRKKKGSKAFKKCQQHRTNLIGYYKNKLDWLNIKVLRIEDIKYLRYEKKFSRYLSHFVYREYFDKLEQTAQIQGVLVEKVCPTYTSQRCSCCGWTQKSNRNGKQFKCKVCGFTADSDFNSSVNISLPDLPAISSVNRRKRVNLLGFYWLELK